MIHAVSQQTGRACGISCSFFGICPKREIAKEPAKMYSTKLNGIGCDERPPSIHGCSRIEPEEISQRPLESEMLPVHERPTRAQFTQVLCPDDHLLDLYLLSSLLELVIFWLYHKVWRSSLQKAALVKPDSKYRSVWLLPIRRATSPQS